ncbi:hypothetical protein LTR56_026388 [Elasticomyces elasticus]|nr:hypothetical protein LTR56_026388 [Elasticomyces elasticus]KAK3662795.1 hypothetical protein LTR22_006411 [Elasticomyces elasticus]KAK4902497.1 hypothetical protein LTR49_026999 [Elasticomyces elasticus]KAK5736980.1 hypothetical protein LTS12_026026 [Elasticomyces elasticus]
MATILEAFDKFEEKFRKVRMRIDVSPAANWRYFVQSDISSRKLHKFLEELEIAPCYKLKAYLALSRLDDPTYPLEAESACRQYLWKAERVLKDCRVVYKSAEDQKFLDNAEKAIGWEWTNLSIRNTSVATSTPIQQGQQTVRVTIKEAYNKYEEKYEKACQPLDPTTEPYFQGATISATLRDFLKEVEGVPYYQLKTYISLSHFDESDDDWKDLCACRGSLEEAVKMLVVCKATYLMDEDVKALEEFEGFILKERADLRKGDGVLLRSERSRSLAYRGSAAGSRGELSLSDCFKKAGKNLE